MGCEILVSAAVNPLSQSSLIILSCDCEKVWVGAVSHGPKGIELNSSYGVRETEAYKDELGGSVVAICEMMMGRGAAGAVSSSSGSSSSSSSSSSGPAVTERPSRYGAPPTPNPGKTTTGPECRGGVLVFFPSYGVMEGAVARLGLRFGFGLGLVRAGVGVGLGVGIGIRSIVFVCTQLFLLHPFPTPIHLQSFNPLTL